jgi:tetratricopeptide (TPR) repeat protein
MDMGRTREAIAEFSAAQARLETLEKQHPHDSEKAADLAATYGNLGLAWRKAGDARAAAEWLHKAIAQASEALPLAPDDDNLMRSAAASYNNLGSLDEEGDGALAANDYEQAIELQRKLTARRPLNQVYQAELARSLNNLGYASALTKDWSAAQRAYAEAIAIQSQLVKDSPLAGSYRRDLAITSSNLGMALSEVGRLDEAAKKFDDALSEQRQLLAARPNDATTLSNMGAIYNNLGMLWERRQQPGEASKAFLSAIEHQKRALAAQPDDIGMRELLSKHYFNYARNLRDQGDLAGSADATLARRDLAPGDADRLVSVLRELSDIFKRLPANNCETNIELRGKLGAEGGETLRMARAAGLAAERANDPAFVPFQDGALQDSAFHTDALLTQRPTP